jgi:hypothetical protein
VVVDWKRKMRSATQKRAKSGKRNIPINLIIQLLTHPVQPQLQRTLRKKSYAKASRITAARARRKKNNIIEKAKYNTKIREKNVQIPELTFWISVLVLNIAN